MSCAYPINVLVNGSYVKVGCGRCLSCQKSRINSLSIISHYEVQKCYKQGLGCSFVTLTYNDDKLPYVNGYKTLKKADLQKFMKRCRINLQRSQLPLNFRYLACGEYGKSGTYRPHYHIVFFGLSDTVAKSITAKCWKDYGLIDVGALEPGGCTYVSKYINKSYPPVDVANFYEANGLQKPFLVHSQNLGFDWIYNHANEIANNDYMMFYNGKWILAPKYIREKVLSITGIDPKPAVKAFIDHFDKDEYETQKDIELKEKVMINQKRYSKEAVSPFKSENSFSWLFKVPENRQSLNDILYDVGYYY